MKQYINLYARLEPPRPAPRALLSIAAVCLVIFLGYSVTAGYLLLDGRVLTTSLAAAQAESLRLKTEISKRQTEDQAINLGPLETKLKALHLRRQQQQLLLAYLDDPASNNTVGFSDAMTGLARQHIPGVAIERFELTQKGRRFLMAGKVQNPTSLPSYMERLGSEAAFARMSFDRIDIREINGQLDFEIASIAETGGDS